MKLTFLKSYIVIKYIYFKQIYKTEKKKIITQLSSGNNFVIITYEEITNFKLCIRPRINSMYFKFHQLGALAGACNLAAQRLEMVTTSLN